MFINAFIGEVRNQRRSQPRSRSHSLYIMHREDEDDLARRQITNIARPQGYMLCERHSVFGNYLIVLISIYDASALQCYTQCERTPDE